jgi:hypothetical protein
MQIRISRESTPKNRELFFEIRSQRLSLVAHKALASA